MFYSNLIRNKQIWSWFTTSYNQNRLPHALLFHGNSGNGKEGHAIELAALVNCRFSTSEGACNSCPDCIKLKLFQHPNVHLIIPYPKRYALTKNDPPDKSLSSKDIDFLVQLRKKKGKDPYTLMELPGANKILINSIRFIKQELYKTSIEAGWKIVLIFQADKLCVPTPESANALLKILEEPPEKTLFILVTDHFSQILDTIKSRCQQTYFPPLDFDDINNVINSTKSDDILKLITHLTDGNIHFIKEILNSPNDIMQEAEFLLNLLIHRAPEAWNQFSSKVRKLKQSGESQWDYKMKLLMIIIRDVLLISENSETKFLFLPNLTHKYSDIVKNYPESDWHQCLQIVENTISNINHNGYLPLMIYSMSIEIHRILNGEKKHFFSSDSII